MATEFMRELVADIDLRIGAPRTEVEYYLQYKARRDSLARRLRDEALKASKPDVIMEILFNMRLDDWARVSNRIMDNVEEEERNEREELNDPDTRRQHIG